MKVLLVSNYLPDAQQSMLRFAEVMAQGLRREGHRVQILHPPALLGRLVGRGHGLGKWLGYVDKYLLFLPALWLASRKSDVVHICDHSNAPYAFLLGGRAHLVTCHDLLAVRGGLGEDTDCPASLAGSLLQRAILAGLKRSSMVVCDSESTRSDLLRLGGQAMEGRSRVVHLGLSQDFQPVEEQACARRLEGFGDLMREPYLLMVGSALRRKNRETALQTLCLVLRTWDVKLVIAGQPLTDAQRALAESLGVLSHIIEVSRPSDEILEALYSRAHVLLFPSRFEGFGWPVVEAQSSGCPVVCGDATSLPEVAGNAALLRHADEAEGFATDILQLRDPTFRTAMIQRGHENVRRFTLERMMDDYLAVYGQLSQPQEDSGLVPDIASPVRQSVGHSPTRV
jgi:glycosyltransferase involved in cell wall biosynthesis